MAISLKQLKNQHRINGFLKATENLKPTNYGSHFNSTPVEGGLEVVVRQRTRVETPWIVSVHHLVLLTKNIGGI